MNALTILLFAAAASLDNLAVGISFGIRRTHIPLLSNAIIAAITMTVTYVALVAGNTFTHLLPERWAQTAGGTFIVAIGLWSIISNVHKKMTALTVSHVPASLSSVLHNPATADRDANAVISWKESFLLGTALALNNVAMGIGAGAAGLSPLWTTLAAGAFSLLALGGGASLGNKVVKTLFGSYSNLVAGVLLIAIGVYQIYFA